MAFDVLASVVLAFPVLTFALAFLAWACVRLAFGPLALDPASTDGVQRWEAFMEREAWGRLSRPMYTPEAIRLRGVAAQIKARREADLAALECKILAMLSSGVSHPQWGCETCKEWAYIEPEPGVGVPAPVVRLHCIPVGAPAPVIHLRCIPVGV